MRLWITHRDLWRKLTHMEAQMSQGLDALTAAVGKLTSAVTAVKAQVADLEAQLAAAAPNEAQLEQLAAEVQAQADALVLPGA